MNKLELFNEACLLVVSYHLFFFTSMVPDPEVQYQVGWSIIVVTLFNLGANMLIIIFKTGY